MSIVKVEHLSRIYGSGRTRVEALMDISFDLAPGELSALVGASGSGKTTLLNMIAGFDRPGNGNIHVLEQDISLMGETSMAMFRRQHMGFVFQTLNLVPTLSAAENVELPLVLLGIARTERHLRVGKLLDRAGLSDRAYAMPSELSAGEQQRIAALRAVAARPKLLLMDEPTSCLDSKSTTELLELLLELNHEEMISMLLTTHDQRVTQALPKSIRLVDGRIADEQTG